MSNHLINTDQKSRPRRLQSEALATKLFMATIAMVAAFFLLATLKIASASTDEINALRVELVQNLAISPDAADYMTTYGSGIIFKDQDIE